MAVIKIVSLDKVGTELKAIRKSRGIVQVEFCKEMGIAPKTLSEFENNYRFTRDQLEDYGNALGITICVLIAMSKEDMNRLLIEGAKQENK